MPVSSIPCESWYIRQGTLGVRQGGPLHAQVWQRHLQYYAQRGRGSPNNPSSHRPLSVPWQRLSGQQLEDFLWSYGSRAVQPETRHPAVEEVPGSEPEAHHPSPRSTNTEESTISTLSLPETESEEPPPPTQPTNWQQLFRRIYLTHIQPYEDIPSEYSRLFGPTRLIYNVPIAIDGEAAVQAWSQAEIRQREGATSFDNILEVHWREYFRRSVATVKS